MRPAAVLPQILLEDVCRLPEARVDIAETDLVGGDDVGRELLADRRGFRGLTHVGHEALQLVFDVDERRGILGNITRVCDDHRDRLADVGHLAVGECEGPGLVEIEAGIRVPHHAAVDHHLGDVVERQHRVDAGNGQGCFLVDAPDQGVRVRTAQERNMNRVGEMDVVDEASSAAQERLVFEAESAGADNGGHENDPMPLLGDGRRQVRALDRSHVLRYRLPHSPPRRRAAPARHWTLRRRHPSRRRDSCFVPAQSAPSRPDQEHRQGSSPGRCRRPRGADARRHRQGDGPPPHGAALEFRLQSRQGLGLRTRQRRGVLRRRAGRDDRRRLALYCRGCRGAHQRRIRVAGLRGRRASGREIRADPQGALDQRHHHLQGRFRRCRRGLQEGGTRLQAGSVAAPRRGAFDRGARHDCRIPRRGRRYHGPFLDAEGPRSPADADLADGLRREPARGRARHRRRLRRQALRVFRRGCAGCGLEAAEALAEMDRGPARVLHQRRA